MLQQSKVQLIDYSCPCNENRNLLLLNNKSIRGRRQRVAFRTRAKVITVLRWSVCSQTDVEVFRKDSKKLPIGDPEIDWEETVYLNLIVHQFDYTLTLAICTRTSPKELQVLKRHSQKVSVIRARVAGEATRVTS